MGVDLAIRSDGFREGSGVVSARGEDIHDRHAGLDPEEGDHGGRATREITGFVFDRSVTRRESGLEVGTRDEMRAARSDQER